MVPLVPFPLPLPSRPPSGYGWSDRALSEISTTTAFNTGLDNRDMFLGERRCVVCGADSDSAQHCHIIMQSQQSVWSDLQDRGWIPRQAKNQPHHEPRNGLLMCPNHHKYFDDYHYFIRFCPEDKKFVFINHSDKPILRQFHGKAIAIDIKDGHAPFPSIFIIHEMRVRGHHPFSSVYYNIHNDIPWQDWILSDGVVGNDSGSFSFKRPKPPHNSNNSPSARFQPRTTNAGDSSSNRRIMPLNADVIDDILAATYASASWKACQMEGTSWAGTGEENIKKYVSSIGVQSHSPSLPLSEV